MNKELIKKYKDDVHDLVWVVMCNKRDGGKALVSCSNNEILIEKVLTIEELVSVRFIEVC